MGLGIPPLTFKILLESNPLKARVLVRRLAVASQSNSRQNAGSILRRDPKKASRRAAPRRAAPRRAALRRATLLVWVGF